MDQNLSINSLAALAKENFSIREFINYYHNTFKRNVAASTIDVYTDMLNVKADAKKMRTYIQNGVEIPMTVEERLEFRKKDLSETLEILNSIEALSKLTDEAIADLMSKENLAPKQITPEPEQEDKPAQEVEATPVTPTPAEPATGTSTEA